MHLPPELVEMGGHPKHFSWVGGCDKAAPFSPLLYALSVEPLAQCICNVSNLESLCKCDLRSVLVSMRIILHLADPGSSLKQALYLIDRFEIFSGLKINWSKSNVLPLDSLPCTYQQASLLLQLCSPIKYLGIKATSHIPDFPT